MVAYLKHMVERKYNLLYIKLKEKTIKIFIN